MAQVWAGRAASDPAGHSAWMADWVPVREVGDDPPKLDTRWQDFTQETPDARNTGYRWKRFSSCTFFHFLLREYNTYSINKKEWG